MSTTTTNPSQDPAQVPECMREPTPEDVYAALRAARIAKDRDSDERRMYRALMEMDARYCPEVGPKVWYVWGGTEPHYVNLDPSLPTCECGDHLLNGRRCAHELCARLWSGENELLILRDLRQDRERREDERAAREARRAAGKAVAA